jgi:hypothetical protein
LMLKLYCWVLLTNHYTITAIRFSKTRSATKTDNLAKSVSIVNHFLYCRKLFLLPVEPLKRAPLNGLIF